MCACIGTVFTHSCGKSKTYHDGHEKRMNVLVILSGINDTDHDSKKPQNLEVKSSKTQCNIKDI